MQVAVCHHGMLAASRYLNDTACGYLLHQIIQNDSAMTGYNCPYFFSVLMAEICLELQRILAI